MLTGIIDPQQFLDIHQGQLEAIAFPRELWRQLHRKLLLNQLARDEPEFQVESVVLPVAENSLHSGIEHTVRYVASTPIEPKSNVFIVEHMLTFEREQLRQQLLEQPALLNSLNSSVLAARGLAMSMMPTENDDVSVICTPAIIEEMIRRLWYFANAYSLSMADENGKPTVHWYWYIMDKLGSALQHSDQPNLHSTSFMELTTGKAYTLIWPVSRIAPDQLCTIDLLVTAKNDADRCILSCAYLPNALSKEYAYFKACLDNYQNTFKASAESYAPALETALSLAKHAQMNDTNATSPLSGRKKISYWLDPAYRQVQDASVRTSERFIPASCPEEADIVWVFDIMNSFELETQRDNASSHPSSKKNRKQKSKTRQSGVPNNSTALLPMLNQFPGERWITVKDLLAKTLNEVYGLGTTWIPRTYNLNDEAEAFLADYHEKQQRLNEASAWITKPWNGTRSEGCAVSDNLPELLKQLAMGPRIIQQYLIQPALLNTRKFDLRILVAVKSLHPLRAYTLKSVPCYARVANQSYTSSGTTGWDNFQQHFTVMNYRSDVGAAQQADYSTLRTQLDEHYGAGKFDEYAWPAIRRCIRDVLLATVVRGDRHTSSTTNTSENKDIRELHPSTVGGLRPYSRSRAIYGVDIMLDDTLCPHLIEGKLHLRIDYYLVSFCPDLKTPIRLHPPLMAELFAFLYLDEGNEHFESANINMKFSAIIAIAVAVVASLVAVEAAPALDRRAPKGHEPLTSATGNVAGIPFEQTAANSVIDHTSVGDTDLTVPWPN
ncbi:tubulin-tyrosine ligase family-domain-containing protein [Syncephalis plumigaleata]|nr:tubulin-tyrosine ligase family-domain-containing protein [Syncephalis plumigaleata]